MYFIFHSWKLAIYSQLEHTFLFSMDVGLECSKTKNLPFLFQTMQILKKLTGKLLLKAIKTYSII